MLQLCRLWQRKNELHLDGVLQCGDFGFFPDPLSADKATRAFAERDPEEMGFARYFLPPRPIQTDPIAEATLGDEAKEYNLLSCPIVWVNGNHEDFRALERVGGGSGLVPVDCYEAFLWLKSGKTFDLDNLTIGGVGGGPETQTKNGHPLMVVRESDCAKLIGSGMNVLLSHAGPSRIGGATDQYGSEHLRVLTEIAQPSYHLFSHYRDWIDPANVGGTQCFWLDDVGFRRMRPGMPAPINSHCMGVLRWECTDAHEFSYVDADWLRALNSTNWQEAHDA